MNIYFRSSLMLLLAGVFAISQTGCDARSPAEQVAEAKVLMEKGNLQDARIQLKNALQADANLLEARWMLGQVSLASGDGAAAEKEIRKAIELGFDPASAQPELLESINLQGAPDRVIKESDSIEIGVSDVDHASILGLRGQALALTGNFAAAGDTLQQALALDSGSVTALVGMALKQGLLRDYDSAREWLAKAMKADPSSQEAWSLLGQVELEQGHAAEAETAFNKAIALRQYSSLEIARRALARVELQKYAEADADISALKKAGFAEDPYVNYVAGVSYFAQSKFSEASEAFEASKKAMPQPYLPREYYMAATYLNLHQLEQARQQAALVNSIDPKSAAAKRLLGATQIVQSELEAATEVLSKAITDSPEDIVMLRMLGYVALLVGNTAQAVEYYERALALDPGSAQVKDELGLAKLIGGQNLDAASASEFGEAASGNERFSQEFLRALASFRDGDLDSALKQARSLSVRYPENVEPLKLMAACHLANGEWDTAKGELERVLQLKPNEPSATRNLAAVETRAGNPEAARKLLRGLVAAYPEDEKGIVSLARLDGQLDGAEAGLKTLEQASEQHPDALMVRSELARAYLGLGRFDRVLEVTRGLTPEQAKKAPELLEIRGTTQLKSADVASAQATFKQWTELTPESPQAHFFYAESLIQGGDTQGAGVALQRSINLDSKYLPARVGEIKVLVTNNDVAKAKERLTALRADFGAPPEVLGIEGWFALGVGDFATATARFSELLKTRPDSELMVLYARSMWGEKKHDQAIAEMNQWMQDHPNDYEVGMQLAEAYQITDKRQSAMGIYKNLIKQYPDSVPALNNLAWLGRDNDLEQSIRYAERANGLSPNDPLVMDTLGRLLVQRGEKDRGHELIEAAAKGAPDNLDIQLHFAEVLSAQGRKSEAKSLLERVVKAGGESPAATAAKSALAAIH